MLVCWEQKAMIASKTAHSKKLSGITAKARKRLQAARNKFLKTLGPLRTKRTAINSALKLAKVCVGWRGV